MYMPMSTTECRKRGTRLATVEHAMLMFSNNRHKAVDNDKIILKDYRNNLSFRMHNGCCTVLITHKLVFTKNSLKYFLNLRTNKDNAAW